ncbi:MAG: hypothetical protein KAT79_06565 [candidate division Zixibacteria bacterium]|nr:hypothetical protein [candidate division Zixibacteria bacterium]
MNVLGEENEGAVAGILWDIYDAADDDYSGYVDWGSYTLPHHPDNIMDSLSNGIDNILSALLDRDVNGHRPDNIDEFWETWFQNPSYDHIRAIRDIWHEHGECCVGVRGNANGDYFERVNIADITYLNNYLFGNPLGPAPVCRAEGNANGDIQETINIADVTYLIDYLYGIPLGPPPPLCP